MCASVVAPCLLIDSSLQHYIARINYPDSHGKPEHRSKGHIVQSPKGIHFDCSKTLSNIPGFTESLYIWPCSLIENLSDTTVVPKHNQTNQASTICLLLSISIKGVLFSVLNRRGRQLNEDMHIGIRLVSSCS